MSTVAGVAGGRPFLSPAHPPQAGEVLRGMGLILFPTPRKDPNLTAQVTGINPLILRGMRVINSRFQLRGTRAEKNTPLSCPIRATTSAFQGVDFFRATTEKGQNIPRITRIPRTVDEFAAPTCASAVTTLRGVGESHPPQAPHIPRRRLR